MSRPSETRQLTDGTRPHLLVANDDGIHAPGLLALARASAEAGYRVSIIAPDTERSGASSSITVHDDLTVREVSWPEPGVTHAWAVSGTPADCAKLALFHLLAGDRPDAVITGVNRGQNTGTCVLYSGTCGAAFEGALLGIPSMAVSLGILWPDEAELRPGMDAEQPLISRHAPREEYARLVNEPDQYAFAATLAASLVPSLLEAQLPWGSLMNLNVPVTAGPDTPIQVGRMSPSTFVDEFKELPSPDKGLRRFRNIGDKLVHAVGTEPWDDMALRHGLISLVPIYFEMTGHQLLDQAQAMVQSLGTPAA